MNNQIIAEDSFFFFLAVTIYFLLSALTPVFKAIRHAYLCPYPLTPELAQAIARCAFLNTVQQVRAEINNQRAYGNLAIANKLDILLTHVENCETFIVHNSAQPAIDQCVGKGMK